MKFRVAREALADAVAWVARSLPTRPPVPVLAGVLLTVTDDQLTVAGYDYEIATQARIGVDAETAGQVLVSGRLLAEITRSLPDKPVDVELDGAKLSIRCGSSRFALPTMPVDDYPALPDMPEASGTVTAAMLAQAVAQTAVAAGKDDTLPMLTGIRLEIEGDTLTLAATDRFRLAVKELGWSPATPGISTAVLVPARTLSEIARTFTGDGQVTIALGEGLIGFSTEDRSTTVRLLDVEFVKYRSLLPTEHTTTVDVSVAELTDAIKRVSLVTDRGHHLRLLVSDSSLGLTAGGEDEGSAEEDLPVIADGAELLIAFNPAYLLDGLGVVHTDTVRLAFTTPGRPALILPTGAEDGGAGGATAETSYQYLVMPARLPG